MDQILLELLCDLERIGQSHEEIYDSEVREQMGDAVMAAYVRHTPGYVLPDRFGMFSEIANIEVKKALALYIERANTHANTIGLRSFHDRLRAFQDGAVRTSSAVGVYYDDFSGTPPPNGTTMVEMSYGIAFAKALLNTRTGKGVAGYSQFTVTIGSAPRPAT